MIIYVLESRDYQGNEAIIAFRSKEDAIKKMHEWADDFKEDFKKENALDENKREVEIYDFDVLMRIDDNGFRWAELEIFATGLE